MCGDVLEITILNESYQRTEKSIYIYIHLFTFDHKLWLRHKYNLNIKLTIRYIKIQPYTVTLESQSLALRFLSTTLTSLQLGQ